MGTKVTLQTIADALGVSRTTVSNAYSRPDQLSDELRDRILATAARLGYRGPNPAARTLRRGRAGALGVVLTESLEWAFGDPYAVSFLRGLAAEAETAMHSVLLVPCPPGEEQLDGVRNAVVDGFAVVTFPDDHPVVDEVLARELPTIFTDGPLVPGHPFVGIDDRAAMADVAGHVIALGHRRVTVLSFRMRPDGRVGPADEERIASADFRVTRERIAGALDTCSEAGLSPGDVDVYEVGINTPATGRAAAIEVLHGPSPPTALLCLSDQIALGVLDALDELGRLAPQDVSVTGFDDIPAAEARGLTTIHQPAADKGRLAAQLLAAPPSAEVVLLDHELIRRGSTGPSPRTHSLR